MSRFRIAAVLAVAALASAPVASPAAGTGVAFDAVTKFAQGDGVSVQPGTFASDFAAASQSAPPSKQAAGPFGFGKMIAQAQAMNSAFRTGIAERHYVAPTKERTDHIALGRADIVDCAARTITTLDLTGKRYSVTSLDAQTPGASSAEGKSAPVPAATDDGTKVALTITNASLGSQTLDGTPADGFSSKMHLVTTKPNGDSNSADMNRTAYYAATAAPSLRCSGPAASVPGGMPALDASLAGYRLAQRALAAKNDGRFTVDATGPALPVGRLALFERTTFARDKGSVTMIAERGNVRAIGDADPAFSVPADFTKVDSL